MDFVVKNTTIRSILDLICPHSCRGCGRLGDVLCECCKNDIIKSIKRICPLCRRVLEEKWKKCPDCEISLDGVYIVGWREGVLSKVVKDFKYQSVRACADGLVEMMDAAIPKEVEEMTVVPLPTIGKHVRQRGLDHTWCLAKKLANKRGWDCERILGRETDTVQVGTKMAERWAQAEKTYRVNKKVDGRKKYLLVDDVWTTGATILAAEKVLREAGATKIYAALLAIGKAREEESPDEPEMGLGEM